MSDSFLPSGAVEEKRYPAYGRYESITSPLGQAPRSVPDHMPTSRTSSFQSNYQSKPYLQSHSPPTRHHGSLSPPISRTGSTDDNSAALIEDWRRYTHNLREQHRGERAHLIADRTRADEVMAEGQALWEKERALLIEHIAQLEVTVEALRRQGQSHNGSINSAVASPPSEKRHRIPLVRANSDTITIIKGSPSDGSGSSNGRFIRQESGRNPDGSRFYEPRPQNPSRSFAPNEAVDMRVDDMPAARATPLCVTSKELTPSDFGSRSPDNELNSFDGSVTSSVAGSIVGESLDISCIQADLEGVAIRVSAMSPSFVAQVLSPQSGHSPAKLSPQITPPLRDVANGSQERSTLSRSASQKKRSTLEIITAPENRRLTMNAGHTPNHSVIKFDGESGNATPTQFKKAPASSEVLLDAESVAMEERKISYVEEDPELTEPLGLLNDIPNDKKFLSALTAKLNEIKDLPPASPSEASTLDDGDYVKDEKPSKLSNDEEDDEFAIVDEPIELPRLKMKPSTNFGKPFGCR